MSKVSRFQREEFGDVSEFDKPTYWTNRVLEILKKRGIEYQINSKTGLYDVVGSVDLANYNLESFGDIRFGIITGYFDCSQNNLMSLEGAPEYVRGYFDCSYNKLTSLTYSPRNVNNNFRCIGNNLITLEGAPRWIKGVPEYIEGNFFCNRNELITLEEFPKQVGGSFYCINNNLTSLEGIQDKILGRIHADTRY